MILKMRKEFGFTTNVLKFQNLSHCRSHVGRTVARLSVHRIPRLPCSQFPAALTGPFIRRPHQEHYITTIIISPLLIFKPYCSFIGNSIWPILRPRQYQLYLADPSNQQYSVNTLASLTKLVFAFTNKKKWPVKNQNFML